MSDVGYALSFGKAATSAVRQVLHNVVRPHLHDVRAMLRLPLPDLGITAGCNFAAVHVLLNVLSGLSRLMGPGPINSGEHFREFVGERYPWQMEPAGGLSPSLAVAAMYDRFRNGFSHDLALSLSTVTITPGGSNQKHVVRSRFPTQQPLMAVTKAPSLVESQLEELDNVLLRPSWVGPTVFQDAAHAEVLDAVALYWGTRRLIFDHTDNQAAVRSLIDMINEGVMRRTQAGSRETHSG